MVRWDVRYGFATLLITVVQMKAHTTPTPLPLSALRTPEAWEKLEKDRMLEILNSLPEPQSYLTHEQLLAYKRQVMDLRVRINRHRHHKPLQDAHVALLRDSMCQLRILLWRMFPFNKLPVEIIVNIFRYAAWSTLNSPSGILLRFRLTWVCRRWRHIAVHDPTLWNTIWFKDVNFGYQRSKLYFERAGTTTLDLRIEDDEKSRLIPGRPMTGDDMNQILDILMMKSNQIRLLVVVAELWPPILVLLDRLYRSSRSLQQLERIEIHRTGRPYRWDGPSYRLSDYQYALNFCNGNTQRIKHICLNGIHLDWERSRFINLSHLDFRRMPPDLGPSLERFRYILQSSPNLKKLSLDGAGPIESTNRYPPVSLPRLESLIIGDVPVQHAIFYAKTIHAPNVREMTLLNLMGEDHTMLFKVLTGKFPELLMLTLYALHIRRVAENGRIMMQWFLSIPKIKFLRVALLKVDLLDLFNVDGRLHISNDIPLNMNPEDRDAFLENGSPLILSRELEAVEVQEIGIDSVIKFVHDRKKLGVPLRKLYIHYNWWVKMNPDEKATIQELARGEPEYFLKTTMPMSLTPAEESIWKEIRGG